MTLLLLACQPKLGDSDAGTSWLTRPDSDAPAESPADSEPPPESEPPDSDPPPVPLELCINEFMPDNKTALEDETGATPDWIELHNPGEEILLLRDWVLADEADPDEPHRLGDVVLPAGGFVVFYADGLPELGDHHLPFQLDEEGETVAVYAPDGRGSVIHFGKVEADFSAARVSDCCEGEGCWDFRFRGSPEASNELPVEHSLVERGATWRWYDLGEAPTGWTEPDFYDEGWSEGPGPLGFGDTHQVTQVDGGPAGDRTPTIYFRHAFELSADPAKIDEVELQLLVDDAALVWLNGQELARKNLPSGEVSHTTWAKEAVGDSAETAYSTVVVGSEAFVEGENVLAVEVHQAAATSSDLGFDLALSLTAWP